MVNDDLFDEDAVASESENEDSNDQVSDDNQNQNEGLQAPGTTTRSGRVSRPPARYREFLAYQNWVTQQ